MDKFTRNYSIVLGALALVAAFWLFYETPGVGRLNDLLSEHAEIGEYPYRFRVLELRDGVATMSTPRSADFPAYRALPILFPALDGEASDSQAMLYAQEEMARIQALARSTVVRTEEVDRVVWKLDEAWLRNQGIDPDRL